MATEDKKYLDLTGLTLLKDKKILVQHPTNATDTSPAAVKVGMDANGHVKLGGALAVGDIQNAAAKSDIKDATITIDINGVKKDFTTNQGTDETLA
jgi:hypothetical protein